MADLTAVERLERARKSIMVAEDRLDMINKQRLPELNRELEDLIVINETKGYKGQTIERTESEIESLQKEKVTLEKTISALQKALPQIEKEARIEITETETIKDYHDALNELRDLISNIPMLDTVTGAITEIENYCKNLDGAKAKFLSLSKGLGDFMEKEKIETLGISMEGLRNDRQSIDYSQVLYLSDALIDLSGNINQLQYKLFDTATNKPLEYRLPTEPKPEPMFSEDGRFKIEKEGESWNGYKKETHFFNGVATEIWKRIYSSGEIVDFEGLKRINDGIKIKGKERAAKERAREIIVGTPIESWVGPLSDE
jgi:DNA repair exonuclease SbcCD ATPase subunit